MSKMTSLSLILAAASIAAMAGSAEAASGRRGTAIGKFDPSRSAARPVRVGRFDRVKRFDRVERFDGGFGGGYDAGYGGDRGGGY